MSDVQITAIVALIGVIVTFFIGVGNLIYSFNNSRKSKFIDTVTASRMKWIGELREELTNFIELILRNDGKNLLNAENGKNRNYIDGCVFRYDSNVINKSLYKLNLMLNGETDSELLDTLNNIKKYSNQYNLCCKITNNVCFEIKKEILDEIQEDILDEIYIKCISIGLEKDNTNNEISKQQYLYDNFICCGGGRLYDFIIEVLNQYITPIINGLVANLVIQSKSYLKEEWERVKLEAKFGDINYQIEKGDGVKITEIKKIKELRKWKWWIKFNKLNLIIKFISIIIIIFIIAIILYKVKQS